MAVKRHYNSYISPLVDMMFSCGWKCAWMERASALRPNRCRHPNGAPTWLRTTWEGVIPHPGATQHIIYRWHRRTGARLRASRWPASSLGWSHMRWPRARPARWVCLGKCKCISSKTSCFWVWFDVWDYFLKKQGKSLAGIWKAVILTNFW